MPALSPTMNDGTLVRWHVKEGLLTSRVDEMLISNISRLCYDCKNNIARHALPTAGDRLRPGMSMFDVETDKSVMTADAMDEAYLAKIVVRCVRAQ